ncbi:MAG: ABC transporter ATP-binding protein, partial [Bacteroidota bacterium]
MARRRSNNEEDAQLKFNRERFMDALGIYEYIRPYRWSLIIGLFLLFLSSLVFMIFPYLSGLMIDIAQENSKLDFS